LPFSAGMMANYSAAICPVTLWDLLQ
jgi:hypothetical protein